MEEADPFLVGGEVVENGDKSNGANDQKTSKLESNRCICKILFGVMLLLSLITALTAYLLYGHFTIPFNADKSKTASFKNRVNIAHEICSNPPLLLISVDGFRPSYLQRNVTPMLQYLILTGVMAEHMRSSFPTDTFPNHYSIVTGLYPESHGIVSNIFYDSKLKDTFLYYDVSSFSQSKWWGGEPIWVTVSRHKLYTGVFFWPGSDATIRGVRPDNYVKYSNQTPFSERVDTILRWFDLPKERRPKFMALYFDQIDIAGHFNGPNSSKLTYALAEVDFAVRRLWNRLQDRNISECVNIMIVSDHGMAVHKASNLVNIANLVPADVESNVNYISVESTANLNVSGGNEVVNRVYDSLVNGASKGLPFRVFREDRIPLRLHTACYNKQRYGQIYAIADVHSTMIINDNSKPWLGNHGFDNMEKEMQALFIGHGPAFKKNYIAESFENIQLYSLMCDVLNITAAPNNGSYGALHGLLDPAIVAKLPAPSALEIFPGALKLCPFPQDEQLLRERSVCEDCVCCCGDSCITDDTILSSNKASFNISYAQKDSYMSYHNPWGVPVGGYGDGACIFSQLDYVSLYSNTLKIPLWSAYTLNPEILDGNMELDKVVIGCWRHDPRISISQSTNCSTYVDPENEDEDEDKIMAFPFLHPMDSSDDLSHSMSVFTNIIFLSRSFHYKVWWTTLLKIEAWFKTYHTPLHVILGVALDANRDGIKDQDSTYPDKHMGVAIPTHFFVVMTRCVEGGDLKACDVKHLKVMGLLLQHPLQAGDYLDVERLLRSSLTPVRDIERLTGINFFPNLSARDQNTLELRLLDELWPTTP